MGMMLGEFVDDLTIYVKDVFPMPQLGTEASVETIDEKSQSDSHGEIDNQETDAEKNTYAESNQSLSTEISVHTILYVVNQVGGKRTVFIG